MVDRFDTARWRYSGDDTPLDRIVRVLEHYNTEWWHVDDAIRFVTTDDRVVEDVELAVEGTPAVVSCNNSVGWNRCRIDFPMDVDTRQ